MLHETRGTYTVMFGPVAMAVTNILLTALMIVIVVMFVVTLARIML